MEKPTINDVRRAYSQLQNFKGAKATAHEICDLSNVYTDEQRQKNKRLKSEKGVSNKYFMRLLNDDNLAIDYRKELYRAIEASLKIHLDKLKNITVEL